jgi:hypothetical protein
MMNMIEKVARKLCEENYNKPDNKTQFGSYVWTLYIKDAKVAIEAMRKPSEEMLNSARDWSVAKHGRGVGNVDATQCWQAMIDAALKE